MFRIIDRELVNLRREEANACMHYRLYHAATLVAGSGVELLLECLVGDLYRAFLADNPDRAEQLKSELKEFEHERGDSENWGLGTWSAFYAEYQIPYTMLEGLGYKPEYFAGRRIGNVVKEWNKCKHDIHEALPMTAHEVVLYLNKLLDSVGIHSDRDKGKIAWRQTWQERIKYWSVQNREAPEIELLMELFPLLDVLERLISDKRIKYEHKTQLMLAENYVFSTIDLVKEDKERPHSLVDDAAVLALTLHWLQRQPTLDKSILSDCWDRSTSADDEIERLRDYIFSNHDKLFLESPGQFGGNLVWAAIRRVSDIGPEALWQNYFKEAY